MMSPAKQQLLISYLISNPDLFSKCQGIISPEYFDPTLRNAVAYIKEHYETYKALPNPEQLSVETGITVESKQLTRAEITYTEAEIEKFCRYKAIERAILASPRLIERGDFSTIEKSIRDAISVGLHRELGTDFFMDAEEWLKKIQSNEMMTPTGWHRLDELLNGGINRQEMLLFAAVSGGGKSIAKANLAVNMIERKLNVLYITLELSEEVVSKRIASMVTGIGQGDLLKTSNDVATLIQNYGNQKGHLVIKRFPEAATNVNHIRAYLKEFELINGYVPDVIIVDYMDLMIPVNNSFSADNVSAKEKAIAEELRALAHQYNCMLVSSVQINRGGYEDLVTIGMDDVAGSMGKVMTTDNLIAVIQTDKMRASGEYMFKLLKTRGAGSVGKYIILKWDPVSLRITDDAVPTVSQPAIEAPRSRRVDLLSIIK